jgi:S1-C subfamily serine protease
MKSRIQRSKERFETCCLVLAAFIWASSLLHSQEGPPKFRIGAELLGGTKSSCPVFIGRVSKPSPAERAGLEPGDRLLTVDGKTVDNVRDAARLVSSDSPGSATLQIVRAGQRLSVNVRREDSERLWREQGWRVVQDGLLVKADATDSEIEYLRRTLRQLEEYNGALQTAFPDRHYPLDKETYYPGFEVFSLNNGALVIVGGIEDGPASRAGIRYGDRILAIDGMDPQRKSVADIEAALSSNKPASVTLKIARGTTPRTFAFALEKSSAVLRENGKKVVNGKIVPLWLPDEYLVCWE